MTQEAKSTAVQKALDAAKTAHRAGRMTEAEAAYREALAGDPDSCAALYGLGMLFLQTGKPDRAVEQFRETLARDPRNPSVLNAFALALISDKRLEAAANAYRQLLAIAPEAVPALNNLGHILYSLGRFDEALPVVHKAAALAPQTVEANVNLSMVLMALGRTGEALEINRRIVALAPTLPEAHNNLGLALFEHGEVKDAAACFEKAVALAPGFVPAICNLANALGALNQDEAALRYYEKALALQPDVALAHYYCGAMLAKLGRHAEATRRFEKAIALDPHHVDSLNGLGNARFELGHSREAAKAFETALALKPDFPPTLCNLGKAYVELGRQDEALALFDKAVALDPASPAGHFGIGSAMFVAGDFPAARASYGKAVALAPKSPTLHLALALSARFVSDDPRLPSLEALAPEAECMQPLERANLFFALGKAYDELQRPEEAFAAFARGNAAKRATLAYDEARMRKNIDTIAETFTPDYLAAQKRGGNASEVPVFVVGMPRSGTTLIEQVLASHPSVFGAGELGDLTDILLSRAGRGRYYCDGTVMTREWLDEIGRRYTAQVRALAPDAARIVDKMPGNFRFAGPIHLAMPNAKIVHVRRDAMDTCFSCFTILFRGRLDFTYELGELGRMYRMYETLMEHWRKVLPPGVMHEVRYEDLIDNFESEARKLVTFCGLPWDERCLRFHETKRSVRTASVAQVRRPLYRSSIGRWKPYEAWLAPLRSALESPPST